MVSVWVTNGAIVGDGSITLNDGRTFTLDDIPGNSWNKNRIGKLTVAIQAILDDRRLIADLEDIDPDKVHALAGDDAWFTARYGGRMFIDGDGVVSRSTLISFTFVDGDLVPSVSVVR